MGFINKKKLFTFCFLLFTFFSIAQESTRNSPSKSTEISGKIMLIPFEPKLYMSEIDQKINQVTKWNFNEIRENFRHRLDAQLKLKLQSIAPVASFYADSVKMSKDLAYIYKSTNLSYDLVGNPTAATAPGEKQNGITNGQITVEINTAKKFMNTKLTNAELLSYLNNKYKSDYFVFVNELDIKNDMNSYNITTDTYQREVTVHYSILDKTGKIIVAGLATSNFSSKENDPKKISSTSFTSIASAIAEKFSAIIKLKETPSPKK